jgi:hypothetical protein
MPHAFGNTRRLFLLSLAGLADAEDHVTAVTLDKSLVRCHRTDQTFNARRGKLHSPFACVADEMQMIWLIHHGFVARHSGKLRLPDHSSRQQDLQRAIDRGNPDPMPLRKKQIADLLHGRMPFGMSQQSPDQLALRGFLQLLACEQFLELFARFHRPRLY